MVVIIDYDLGNPKSIKNMLKKINVHSIISSSKNDILNSNRLILPGVGSFDYGIKKLKEFDLIDVLEKKVIVEKTPFLGICLGMQLLFDKSEEGQSKGLGWVKGECLKFSENVFKYPVPNMGWLETNILKSTKFTQDLNTLSRYYYLHSYYVKCLDKSNIMMQTSYNQIYTSAVIKDNIIGVQFHPEKSHKFGMKLFKNFISINE